METTQEKKISGELGRADSRGDSDNKDNMTQCPAGFKPAGAPSGASTATCADMDANVSDMGEIEEVPWIS